MDIIQQFIESAKKRTLTVALPEGQDERVITAARRLRDEGIAQPIVLGKPELIEAAATQAGISLDGIDTLDPRDSDKLDAYTRTYVGKRDLDERVARRMVLRPLFYGGMMVRCGDADTLVAGVATATATVIQAGALTVGYAPGIETASSFFLMVIPSFQGQTDKPFIYADCAVNISPTPEQLADIALASHASAARLLNEEPRVALLSFSTKGSASHIHVDQVNEALVIIKQRAGDLKIDGELQADAAIIPSVGARKVKDAGPVVGHANVLIFPDLNSGNIAYKLTQYMANARAIGPFLQGFAKPISDLSRGASAADIVATTAVCLAQVQR
ncbi:MAG: phosphotransacetylase [Phycisphaeraceae bacterium]|nr:phosphotransacetylase [Phycisphaeraceae bacterium]